MNYLALCCIARDEDEDYLKEWVHYHTLAGVEHFYIYDNQSRKPIAVSLAAEVMHGNVTVMDIPGEQMQIAAYTHCLQVYGNAARWIAFLDADEFLYPKTCDDLRVFLVDYEKFPALAVNWMTFGSSGFQKKPAELQIGGFLRRTPRQHIQNRFIKSILQPVFALFPLSAHAFLFRDNLMCVNEQFNPVGLKGLQVNENSVEKIQINHYYCRSYEDYEQKIRRGRADSKQTQKPSMAIFDEIDRAAVEEDRGLLELYRRLSQKNPSPPSISAPAPAPVMLLPDNDVLVTRFLYLMELFQKEKNLKTIELILTVMPVWYDRYLGFTLALADFYNALGNTQAAWLQLSAAWRIDSTSPEVLKRMGGFLMARGDYDKAEKVLLLANAHAPADRDVLAALGQLYITLQRYEEARRCLEQALLLNHSDAGVLAGLQLIKQRTTSP